MEAAKSKSDQAGIKGRSGPARRAKRQHSLPNLAFDWQVTSGMCGAVKQQRDANQD